MNNEQQIKEILDKFMWNPEYGYENALKDILAITSLTSHPASNVKEEETVSAERVDGKWSEREELEFLRKYWAMHTPEAKTLAQTNVELLSRIASLESTPKEEELKCNCEVTIDDPFSGLTKNIPTYTSDCPVHGQFAKEEGQQWISVETPPKELEKVLAMNEFRHIRVTDWESFTNRDLNWFQRTFTHWLPISILPPLPSAPTDKNDNV